MPGFGISVVFQRGDQIIKGIPLSSPILQQDCAAECAQSFFSALADLTEKLLLELDETITVDDVKVPGKKRRDCLFRSPLPYQRLQQSVPRKRRL